MRISLKRTVQVALIFGWLLVLNSLYVELDRIRNSITEEVEVEQADPKLQQHGDGEASDRSDANWGQSLLFNLLHPPVGDKGQGRNRRSVKSKDAYFRDTFRNGDKTLQQVFQPSAAPALVTPAYRPTQLEDIFISVKTTQKFHKERLDLILNTWYLFAKDQTHFFTDTDDHELRQKSRHVVNTNCSSAHSRAALCCKMSVEYDTFMTSGKRWFCHVDDDTYVNVPALVELLQNYNHTQDWYIGKPSLNHPIEKRDIINRDQKTLFWFATGGAGFCLSRAMAMKMMPYTAGGKLWTVCDRIRLPDDCTVGFIIYYYLKKELTVVPNFHSHLEGLWRIKSREIEKQITFSYGKSSSLKVNIVDVEGFNKTHDPTRFKSIHCALFPNLQECPKRKKR